MDLGLSGKVAVVTGASKGIGLAVARTLIDEGAHVITGSRTITPELKALGAEAYEIDLSTPDGPADLIARTDHLDILVNNVGAVTPRTEGFLKISDLEWLETLNLSLLAAIRTTRAAIPHLLLKGGSVVTIGSVNSYLPDPGVIDYSAAKAALWNVSKSWSKEFGPAGIRFNSISPGPVSSPLWLGEHGVAATIAKTQGVDLETAKAAVVAKQSAQASTGRFTEPEEVAALVAFLASDRAANITGSDYPIDGGLIKTL